MAASPIYQRGKLVQFGFTNSHPDFTKGGDYMWSNAPNQADDMPALADYAIGKLGLRKLAVVYINGDWGKTSKDIFLKSRGRAWGHGGCERGLFAGRAGFPLDPGAGARCRAGGADPDRLLPGWCAGGAPGARHGVATADSGDRIGLFAQIP